MDQLNLDCGRYGLAENRFDFAGLFAGHSMNIRPLNLTANETDRVAHCNWHDDRVTDADTLRYHDVLLNSIIYSVLFLMVLLVLWEGRLREIARAGEDVDEDAFWNKWPVRMFFQQSSGEPIAKSAYLDLVRHHLCAVAVLTLVALPVLGAVYALGGLNIRRRVSVYDQLAISNLEVSTQLDIVPILLTFVVFLVFVKTRPDADPEEGAPPNPSNTLMISGMEQTMRSRAALVGYFQEAGCSLGDVTLVPESGPLEDLDEELETVQAALAAVRRDNVREMVRAGGFLGFFWGAVQDAEEDLVGREIELKRQLAQQVQLLSDLTVPNVVAFVTFASRREAGKALEVASKADGWSSVHLAPPKDELIYRHMPASVSPVWHNIRGTVGHVITFAVAIFAAGLISSEVLNRLGFRDVSDEDSWAYLFRTLITSGTTSLLFLLDPFFIRHQTRTNRDLAFLGQAFACQIVSELVLPVMSFPTDISHQIILWLANTQNYYKRVMCVFRPALTGRLGNVLLGLTFIRCFIIIFRAELIIPCVQYAWNRWVRRRTAIECGIAWDRWTVSDYDYGYRYAELAIHMCLTMVAAVLSPLNLITGLLSLIARYVTDWFTFRSSYCSSTMHRAARVLSTLPFVFTSAILLLFNLWRNRKAERTVSRLSTILAWAVFGILGGCFLIELGFYLYKKYGGASPARQDEEDDEEAGVISPDEFVDYQAPVVHKYRHLIGTMDGQSVPMEP